MMRRTSFLYKTFVIMAVAVVSDRQLALFRSQVSSPANMKCSTFSRTLTPCDTHHIVHCHDNHQICGSPAAMRPICRIDISYGAALMALMLTILAADAPQIAQDRERFNRGRSAADAKAATRRAAEEKAAQWAAAVLADRAQKALQRQQKLAELEALRVQVLAVDANS
jgi:hypothetical protein